MDLDLQAKFSRWWVQLLTGLALIAIGIIFMAWPGVTTFVLLIFIAAFILVDGLFAIGAAVGAMHRKESSGIFWARGIIEIIVGAIALWRPGATFLVATIVIGVWLIVDGVLEIVSGIKTKDAPGGFRWLVAITGVLSIVIGFLFLFVPVNAALGFVIVLGLVALVFGILRAIVGISLRIWVGKKPKTPAIA